MTKTERLKIRIQLIALENFLADCLARRELMMHKSMNNDELQILEDMVKETREKLTGKVHNE